MRADFPCLCWGTGVMNVIVTVSHAKEGTYMKTFTLDAENNISAFATPEEAVATTATPFDTFASQKELLSLIGQGPAERLVAIWNSLPGVKPVKRCWSAPERPRGTGYKT